MSDDQTIVIVFVVLLVGLTLGFLAGLCIERESWKQDTVKAGVAEFYIDSDFQRDWRFKKDLTNQNTEL